ncbi:MAG: N-acetyl-alpha-D-glucosaminyl L-malate synthase BshA, partial [Actinobacteria bacterium]|nr:N-acetyl-alpha-D-glucosaminyl L-malate synthase BshA [Actinomycetota bacterium]
FYPPYTLSLSVKMSEVIESFNLDIIHVHYAMPHAASAYLAKKIVGENKIKYITTLHGTDITLVGNHASFFKITKFSIENSDGITCVSRYLKDLTDKIFNINKDMRVIYNFIDTERYTRDNRLNKDADSKGIHCGFNFIDRDDMVISHISNFRPVKKVQNIIKAFCKITRSIKAKLILIGDGPEIKKCRILTEKLNLSDKVFFIGILDDIIPLLSISDLYMLPSKNESFGLSALEALRCSVPLVGTKFGGLPEVVVDGVCGYLVDPDDVELLASSALRILCDKDLKDKMGFEARKRAKLFDSSIIIPQFLNYYNYVLKN